MTFVVPFHVLICFFFNDTATTEIYTLSLHDALPICGVLDQRRVAVQGRREERLARHEQHDELRRRGEAAPVGLDRKSTRLNSSHANISYAVFCLKKKTNKKMYRRMIHYTHNNRVKDA